VKREEHVVGETFAYRFPGEGADHALLVQHGLGGHGGIYDKFGAHYAGLGADVWCMDAPGHGRSASTRRTGSFTLQEWVNAATEMAEHIESSTGLPVIIKGSSLGATAAYCAYAASDVFAGAVLMGFMIPSSPMIPVENPFRTKAWEQMAAMFGDALEFNIGRYIDFDVDYGFDGAAEQKRHDPLNTWTYDLAAIASILRYDPAVALADNTKPILFAVGQNDPIFTLDMARSVVDATAGPVDFYVQPNGVHQLMLFHTAEYSQAVCEWSRKRVANRSTTIGDIS
jgi:pimeloyl-ACP methyl ester carboxylesterase